MLSGESTPLLKESIALLESQEKLEVDGSHRNAALFSGTKLLQSSSGGSGSQLTIILALTSHDLLF